ncbi:MAG: YkgJ family cysteine cluster protein [Candidatus Latescibacterota bacterium]
MPNPCLTCGACCAHFRAAFYWAEGDDATPGGVPVELTEKVDPFRRAMWGTSRRDPRCVALQGSIGVEVACSIYGQRPSPCRQFEPSWADGTRNERCDRARLAWGLAPLAPDAWSASGQATRAA